MKIPIAIISSLVWIVLPVAAEEHLKESRSPLMTTEATEAGMEGVWIPDSYGGITGVVLDLDQVGTNHMLRVRNSAGKSDELIPFSGVNYKIHSDQTVEDRKEKTTTRTVILTNDARLDEFGLRDILCYKIHFQESTPGRSEATHYSLTFSSIKNEFEVRFLIPFRVSFPNREHPDASKPNRHEQDASSNF
jgi:hypothetical protein